jgi:mono/diheme cytochrome c family protein
MDFRFVCLIGLVASFAHVEAAPVVAGYERVANDDSVSLAEKGELLLGELNCLGCHAARSSILERVGRKKAPNLGDAGARMTPQYIREYLSDPHGEKAGTMMPDLFHASDAPSKARAIDFLTHFLVSKSGPIKPSRTPVNEGAVDAGRKLFHSVGCIACHAPESVEGITTPIIPLPKRLAAKTTVEEMARFLQNPLHVRASGRMPDLGLDAAEATSIATYLLRDQIGNPDAEKAGSLSVAGWHYEYFELPKDQRKLPDFSGLTPKTSGITKSVNLNPGGLKRRPHNFALRFTADLQIPKKANYEFWLRSDDGSRLFIDSKMVIDGDGVHPSVEKNAKLELSKGSHTIEVQYFEFGGNLDFKLLAKGPGLAKRNQKNPIPPEFVSVRNQTPMVPLGWSEFAVDSAKARVGGEMFQMLRCAACHELSGMKVLRPAPVLSELNPETRSGCLGEGVRRNVPNYDLNAGQRAALQAVLKDQAELAKPLPAAKRIEHDFARMNCYACHQRDGIGGPDDQRAELFKTNIPVDLGEEGKIPPSLTGVGGKLKKRALQSILYDGDLHIRYFMSTRMPKFGRANVSRLIDDLVRVDQTPADLKAPEFSEESMEIGKRLVGMTGLFCINCHLVNEGKGPGIPGVDLATVEKRINPGWFNRLLKNPVAINKGTRMPAFWPDGQSALPTILGGDTDKQIGALWNYLSLGESMPAPIGIQPVGGVGMELIPTDRPIIHRTFMTDVGPRSILIGFPERVHVAFDANVIRLAKAWRGRFFDGSGVASGRSDKFFDPLGKDVIDLPSGPAFAQLKSQSDPWPKAEKTDRNIGGRFKGYSLDEKGRPTLRYQLGEVWVEESIQPLLRPGGSLIVRSFVLTSPKPSDEIFFLAGQGQDIDHTSTTDWIVDAKLNIAVDGEGVGEALVREGGEAKELLLPVKFRNGRAKFDITLSW